MVTATARKVDDQDYATLAESARANGRSISAELREWIAEAARKRRAEQLLAEMREFAKRNPLKLPEGMTSLDLLREERDSW